MINIVDKQECNGCCACVDSCSFGAITLKVDHEGFWYPYVNKDLCTDCGLCERNCPELNSEKLNQTNQDKPSCYAAYHLDESIRLDSTSGGAFSALAQEVYSRGGYVAGAIYQEDRSVKHFISNNIDDLNQIRSSKYLQSDCSGIYKAIKRLLQKGSLVLVCGGPCQMGALRLFLNKDYDNLIICDYICRGINSPLVFKKHIESLEQQYRSKAVYLKAKNKELGWRALTFKATFENGKSYYGNGQVDNFTRGYLQTQAYCRPSCYDCKFKTIPRIADITLADFWGIEKIAPDMDNNTGTSMVLCNNQKGKDFFQSIQNRVKSLEVTLQDCEQGNRSLYASLNAPTINREHFFKELKKKNFSTVAQRYFPNKISLVRKVKRVLLNLYIPVRTIGLHPRSLIKFVWLNVFRPNTSASWLHGNVMIPMPYTVLDIHKSAYLSVKGICTLGVKRVRGSKLETRLLLDPNSSLEICDNFFTFNGVDIQIFSGGKLKIEGGRGAGMNMHTQVVCKSTITIGKRVLIGRNVVIRDYDAHYLLTKGYKISKPIVIGDDCWIGDGSIIIKGSKIGNGSVVSMRSMVIGKIPEKVLVSGSPAIVLERDITWKR